MKQTMQNECKARPISHSKVQIMSFSIPRETIQETINVQFTEMKLKLKFESCEIFSPTVLVDEPFTIKKLKERIELIIVFL